MRVMRKRLRGGGGGSSRLPSLSFGFAANGSIIDSRTGIAPTFTRATIKTITDWEGAVRNILSGEVPFNGLRRVQNYLAGSSENFLNGSWTSVSGGTGSAAVCTGGQIDPLGGTGAFRIQLNRGASNTGADISSWRNSCIASYATTKASVHSIWIKSNTGGNNTVSLRLVNGGIITATPNWQRMATGSFDNSVFSCFEIATGAGQATDQVVDVTVFKGMAEAVVGQSNVNASEYVSVGVLSAPYNGAGVDGVRYFPWLNGNTVSSNVVTEATGAAIPASGFGIGWLPGLNSNFFTTPDSVASSITGELDIRCFISPTSWAPAFNTNIASKWGNAGNLSWLLQFPGTGALAFSVSVDGTASSTATSSSATGFSNGTAHWVRITRTIAGTVTFYTSDDGKNWTQLGTPQATTAGAIFDSSILVGVGGRNVGGSDPFGGNIYRFQMYSGINGTLAVDFNSNDWSSGTTFVSSTTGETWTLNGGAKINKWPAGYRPETAATNLFFPSENQAGLTAISTPTITSGSDRIGNIVLDTVNDTSAVALQGTSKVCAFTGNAVKAISIYFKQGTSTSSVVRVRDTTAGADRLLAAITWTNGIPTVTMTTGTLIGVFPVANGGWRAEMLTANTLLAANTNQVEMYPATDNTLAVGATGTILWNGVMAEDNATRCHSYIPTTTATVTANKDQMAVSSLGSWFNAAAGTFVSQVVADSSAPGVGENIAQFDDGTANNRILIRRNTVPSLEAIVSTGGVIQADIGVTPMASGIVHKAAFAWVANDFAATVDALAPGTDAAGTIPTVTTLNIGQDATAVAQFEGIIQKLDYYPRRIGNGTLQGLTS